MHLGEAQYVLVELNVKVKVRFVVENQIFFLD